MIEWLLDLIFPKVCSSCGSEGHYFCAPTSKSKPIIEFYPRPKRGWYLDGLIAAAPYHDQSLRQAIHTLKYERVPEVAKQLGEWMVASLRSRIDPNGVIVPVPLHPRRLIFRGFNQATLLAQPFALAGFEVVEALERRIDTVPQVELKRSKRAANVAAAFSPTSRVRELRQKAVFLLDDVATTGNTLNAAAKVLKAAGAKKVFGLVVARD